MTQSGLADEVSNKTLWDYSAGMINWANDNLEANITLWDTRPTLEEFLEGSITPSGKYYSPDNWGSQPETDGNIQVQVIFYLPM
jgi:hypothetical protein